MTNIKTHFENKQHYLDFRAEWACAVNSPKAKSTLVPCDEWLSNEGEYGKVSHGTGVHRKTGWITGAHHLLFNILCEKRIDNGFTLRTNIDKIKSGEYEFVNEGLVLASYYVRRMIEAAKRRMSEGEPPVFLTRALDEFIEPFGDTVSYEMLANLELDAIKGIALADIEKEAA